MKYNFNEENLKEHYWWSDNVYVLVFGYDNKDFDDMGNEITSRIEIEYIKDKK